MDQTLLGPLEAFSASLNTLIHSLTTTTTYLSAPKAASDLVAADTDLDTALSQLQQHQTNHQTLLKLRAQRDALQETLRATVREAWSLRQQLGDIHPSILDDIEDPPSKGVDYSTLLSFALRIGKHNAIAAQEAERASEAQFVEAKRKKTQPNGDVKPVLNGESEHKEKTTQEAQATLRDMQTAITFQRVLATAPFPNAEDLRKGALGRLQLIKESFGEETMDAEVEKMVRESEMRQVKKDEADLAEETKPTQMLPQQQQQHAQRHAPQVPAKKIDLDFPGDDDDSDDD